MSKKAVIQIRAIEIHCPECGEAIPEPKSGSLMWELPDPRLKGGKPITCVDCGATSVLPFKIDKE